MATTDHSRTPASGATCDPASRGRGGISRGSVVLLLAALLLPLPPGGTLRAGPKAKRAEDLWALRPLVRPALPASARPGANPVDAFIEASLRERGLTPLGRAEPLVLLRRVYLDLIGIPPSPAEQEAFLSDHSPDAYEKVVDRLLASEQHGVRYGRRWLDVLRYADEDEQLVPSVGLHHWRDWVIGALNEDLPYDQFVRAQLTGYRGAARTQITATGHRVAVPPRADDLFALGFLARGAARFDGAQSPELAISAVETISTAFMGMTVGCAKCHDHFYDPISKRDYYAMKALFDPLVVRKVVLAGAEERVANGKARAEAARKRAALEAKIAELAGPYRERLYEERLAMLPGEVQQVIRKPEKQRTAAERKIADDYYPVLRIDAGKISEVMPEGERKRYGELRKELDGLGSGGDLPACFTVEVDPARALEKSFILISGDPQRPDRAHEVEPGWPFGPANPDLREGRVEALSDWLTAPENPLFPRVAVNRIWQWHFGEGLHALPSDLGSLGGVPAELDLLNWLAAEFVSRGFGMKSLHRLMVTSEAYRRSSETRGERAAPSLTLDPALAHPWAFRLQRLDAEGVWDSIFASAGRLDLRVGGPSFDGALPGLPAGEGRSMRRGAYLVRGFSASRDVLPPFLQTFDVDDGRVPCPVRTRTVTAPQSLFLMNSREVAEAADALGHRVERESGGDLGSAIDRAYALVLCRPPTHAEHRHATEFLAGNPARLVPLAWVLLNLDEFLFVR